MRALPLIVICAAVLAFAAGAGGGGRLIWARLIQTAPGVPVPPGGYLDTGAAESRLTLLTELNKGCAAA